MIVVRNWNKYQGDFSVERTKKWREKKSVTRSVTSNGESDGLRREEKRRDLTSTSLSSSKPPSADARSGASPPLAPLQGSTKIEAEEEPDFGHEDFKRVGWLKSDLPRNDFEWEHLERSLPQVERVQSKMREKFYAQKKHWN